MYVYMHVCVYVPACVDVGMYVCTSMGTQLCGVNARRPAPPDRESPNAILKRMHGRTWNLERCVYVRMPVCKLCMYV